MSNTENEASTTRFDLALKALPDSCKKLHEGSSTATSFTSVSFKDVIADFKARMALFYADFNDEKTILEPPKVNRRLLEKAVNELLDFMRNQNYP